MGYPFTPGMDVTFWVCFGPPWSLVVGHIPQVGPLGVGIPSFPFSAWWWRFKAPRRHLSCIYPSAATLVGKQSWNRCLGLQCPQVRELGAYPVDGG